MDFLISSENILTSDIEKCYEFRTDSRVKQHQKYTCENFDLLVFSNASVNVLDNKASFWDGQYSIKGEYRHPTLLDSYPDIEEVEYLSGPHELANGIFCAVFADLERACFSVSRDNLSQYPLYYVEKLGQYYISNNSRMLSLISGCEARNAMGGVESCIYGGVYNATHFNDVKFLDFNLRLEGGASLVFKKQENDFFEGHSYDEVMAKAYSSISDHISAVSKIKGVEYLTSDLTGGTDSRILLAFLLENFERDRVGYRCMGRYPNPDVNVAAYLIEELGLTKATYPNVNVSLEQKIRNSAALAGGTIQADVSYSPKTIPNSIHFQGTYGELSGSFGFDPYRYYESKGESYSFENHAKLISNRRYNAGIIDIITDDARRSAESSYALHLNSMNSSGVKSENLSMELKLRVRSRSHFGMQSFVGNKTKILPSPFANRWLLAARYLLDNDALSKKKALYDLGSLSSKRDVLWYPMAGRKWDKSLIAPSDINTYNNIDVILRDTKNLTKNEGALFSMKSIKSDKYRSIVDSRAVSDVKGSLHNAKLKTYLSMTELFLKEYDSTHELWQYWERNKLLSIIKKDAKGFRPDGLDIEVLGLFISSATWLVGLDKWQGIG